MSSLDRIINESIQKVISENESIVKKTVEGAKKFWRQAQDDMSRGRAAEIVYDKLHPEKPDLAYEVVKKLAKQNAELAQQKAELVQQKAELAQQKGELAQAENMGVREHLTKAGQKAWALGKSKIEDIKNAVSENPGLAAATAAALIAGAGGLAAVKRMRKSAK